MAPVSLGSMVTYRVLAAVVFGDIFSYLGNKFVLGRDSRYLIR